MRSKFKEEGIDTVLTDKYKRILIQDSTVIRLPLKLFGVFSGVKNAAGSVCNARIQGIYDLIAGEFVYFSIDPYSKNDTVASIDIPVRKGDLVLRDRGYFNLTAVKKIIEAGASYC